MEDFHPVPKPKSKRKKKLYNGWKNRPRRMCYYCGTYNADRHEIYGGSNRQKSIEMGFQIDLCRKCHKAIHAAATPLWQERKQYWQCYYQREFEDKLIAADITPAQARDTWMSMIGKNYLDEVD